jgi:hypothetical protein
MTYEKELANQMLGNAVEYGHSRTISFITTHPNVSISIFKGGMEPDTYLEVFRNHDIKENTNKLVKILSFYKVWNCSNKNARWSFNPRNGLTLKNPTVFDSARYYIFGRLPFVNGKPVNITLSHRNGQITKEMIREIFPVDRIDAIDGIECYVSVEGNTNCDITLV